MARAIRLFIAARQGYGLRPLDRGKEKAIALHGLQEGDSRNDESPSEEEAIAMAIARAAIKDENANSFWRLILSIWCLGTKTPNAESAVSRLNAAALS